MIKDYFKIAIKNLRKRQLKSWLTLVGIFMSIAIIFILISLSLGLQMAIEEQFQQLGSDKFFIQPSGQFGPPGSGSAVELTTDDVDIVQRMSGIKDVTYMTGGNAKVEFDDKIRYFPMYGIPEGGMDLYMESGSLSIDEGRLMKKTDNKEVLLGSDFKNGKVFDKPLKAGSSILINDIEFRVVGIFEPVGNPADDKNIILGIEDLREISDVGYRTDYIVVQISPGENLKDVADSVERRLMKFRDVTEKTKDFSILTPEELLKSFQNILGIITYFLIGVAGISLLVGSIGIANTMYTSILERTKEIGVMKAIGARNSDILLIFLIESGLIGATGGILGVLIGIGIAKSVEFIAINQLGTNLLKAATPFYLIAGCIAFAFVIGALSGLVPAYQASKTKTVDALRYE